MEASSNPPSKPGTTERQAECHEHGPFASRHIMGPLWSRCPTCTAIAAEATQRADALREAREAETKLQAALTAARIPGRFIGRTFAGYVAETDAQRHALTTVREFTESFAESARKGQGLVLAGLPGTGKTHLAVAALQALLVRPVGYATCMDLIRIVRDTWRRDSERSESQVLNYFERLDLLVIDEIGANYGTEGEQSVLFDVLDRRYREVRPTILLTNQDKEGFKKFIGERTFDRLTETCRWVPFDWPSYRPTARREAA